MKKKKSTVEKKNLSKEMSDHTNSLENLPERKRKSLEKFYENLENWMQNV